LRVATCNDVATCRSNICNYILEHVMLQNVWGVEAFASRGEERDRVPRISGVEGSLQVVLQMFCK